MDLNLTTPALLFPAISLLLLAYTSRFLALANLVRELHSKWQEKSDPGIRGQIDNLKKRIRIIKSMQLLGVSSFFLCVLTMLLVFVGFELAAEFIFAIALALLLSSLAFSIKELFISADALDILLDSSASSSGCADSSE
jgi:ABC-type sugar transport system permease subunit